MDDVKWEVAVKIACEIGEGPVWDKRNACIYWLDIPQGFIYQFSPSQNKLRAFETKSMTGSFSIRSSGGLIAAQRDGFAIIDPQNEIVKIIATGESNQNIRFNDGKCDPAGRFWAGTMDMSGYPNAGSLYMLDINHQVSIKIKEVSCSNGLAWSADNKKFYFIDTPSREVTVYDYDIGQGNIANKRVIYTFKKGEGYPDGMTIDAEGMLWVALWGGWKIVRMNPNTGQVIFKFDLPVSRVTSCTFGGETLEDIYITSASSGLSDAEIKEQPLAGSLFIIKKSGFKGLDAFEYKG